MNDRDTEILERLRLRDVKGAEMLYDTYATLVWVVAVRITDSIERAEGIFVSTFVEAWETFRAVDEFDRTLGAWLVQIARRIAGASASNETLQNATPAAVISTHPPSLSSHTTRSA